VRSLFSTIRGSGWPGVKHHSLFAQSSMQKVARLECRPSATANGTE